MLIGVRVCGCVLGGNREIGSLFFGMAGMPAFCESSVELHSGSQGLIPRGTGWKRG